MPALVVRNRDLQPDSHHRLPGPGERVAMGFLEAGGGMRPFQEVFDQRLYSVVLHRDREMRLRDPE